MHLNYINIPEKGNRAESLLIVAWSHAEASAALGEMLLVITCILFFPHLPLHISFEGQRQRKRLSNGHRLDQDREYFGQIFSI